jgi:acetyl-CoA acetyltransferase
LAHEEFTIRDRVAVAGVGETEYTKAGMIGRSEFQLACEAILKAVGDAGLRIEDIDGFCSYADDRNDPARLSHALGIPAVRVNNLVWPSGGLGSCGSVANAASAIVAGYAKYVVAFRALAQGSFGRFGQGGGARTPRVSGGMAYNAPFGVLTPAQMLGAFPAQRHMYEYGTKQEHFGAVAVACYKHAQRNPRAVMYGRPLTMEDYLNSRWIARPIHLYDCCLENDGAAAVVITSAERAKDLKQRPVNLLAAAQGNGYRYGQFVTSPFRSSIVTSNHENLASELFSMAGIGPREVDTAQLYANFTPQVLMTLEDFGFCEKGEGGHFVEDGRIEWPDGELPVNTSGAQIAEAYIHGFEEITEGVRQMRGSSTCQVEDAEVCLVAAGPGVPNTSALLLRRV